LGRAEFGNGLKRGIGGIRVVVGIDVLLVVACRLVIAPELCVVVALVVVLFAGASGNVGLGLKDGLAEAARRHLFSRQRELFATQQFAVLVVDAPSDQKDMDEEFRRSAKHSVDMEAVAREVQSRFPKARLVLIGHSRGTVSAGYVARTLGEQISAIVLMSGRYHVTPRAPQAKADSSGGPGLSEIDLGSLKGRVLLVHHAKDACPGTPFSQAEQLSARLPMIKVKGSDEMIK
jgi:predicted esterase